MSLDFHDHAAISILSHPPARPVRRAFRVFGKRGLGGVSKSVIGNRVAGGLREGVVKPACRQAGICLFVFETEINQPLHYRKYASNNTIIARFFPTNSIVLA
jgi:hypothetical protein